MLLCLSLLDSLEGNAEKDEISYSVVSAEAGGRLPGSSVAAPAVAGWPHFPFPHHSPVSRPCCHSAAVRVAKCRCSFSLGAGRAFCRPPALAGEAAAPRTASAGVPGGLAGHERELPGQEGGTGVARAACGLGSAWEQLFPGFFPFFARVCLCWMSRQIVPSADGL